VHVATHNAAQLHAQLKHSPQAEQSSVSVGAMCLNMLGINGTGYSKRLNGVPLHCYCFWAARMYP
jgi:hypothetical protein